MAATMAFPQSATAESPTGYNRKSHVRSIFPTFPPVLFPALMRKLILADHNEK